MKDRARERHLIQTMQRSIEGNRITLHAAEYIPKEIQDQESVTIVIPGWSMQGNTRALKNMAAAFAEQTHARTITLSATFTTPHPNSLQQQSESMEAFIRETGAKRITIVAYSEGSAKALKLTTQLEKHQAEGQQTPHVEGLILLSPLGLAEHQQGKLAVDLAKAAFFHIPFDTLKGITRNPLDWKKFFEAEAAAMAIFYAMGKRALRRGPLGYLHHVQQELNNMAAPIPEMNQLQAPVIVIGGDKDTVVPLEGILNEASMQLPNVRIIPFASAYSHHGMPFQEYEGVARESIQALRMAQNLRRGKVQ